MILVIYGCRNTHYESEKVFEPVPIKYASPNEMYRRDSIFVIQTVWEFINKEVYVFDFAKKYNLPLHEIEINVDTILYSPDTLKMLAFIIKKMPDMEAKHINDYYYYSGCDLKGFRNSTHEPWKIYPTFLCAPSGMPNYNRVRYDLRYFYFNVFKNTGTYVWDSGSHEPALAYFNYNADERNFWDSSVLWKKGARTPGDYLFQNKGNVKPGDENAVWILPPLDYPDSLLKLYK
jgi:hypothetical protein